MLNDRDESSRVNVVWGGIAATFISANESGKTAILPPWAGQFDPGHAIPNMVPESLSEAAGSACGNRLDHNASQSFDTAIHFTTSSSKQVALVQALV